MLTYRKRINTPPFYVDKELRIPEDWGMFTKQGNKSLEKKAELLVKKIEENKDYEESIFSFLRSFRRMHTSKNMSEASDTEVREQVWSFLKKVCSAINISEDIADYFWEHEKSYPK